MIEERITLGSSGKAIEVEHFERYKFAKKFVKNKVVLDLACGTGYGSFELKKAGAKKVLGGDISQEAINFAKKRYNLKNLSFKVMDCINIPLKDNSIDVIISFETIEHIPDYKKFLIEVKRVLKSGGLFICSSPNKMVSSPFNKSPLNPYHILEFSSKKFQKLISSSFLKNNFYGQIEVNQIKNLIIHLLRILGLSSFLKFLSKIIKKQNKGLKEIQENHYGKIVPYKKTFFKSFAYLISISK